MFGSTNPFPGRFDLESLDGESGFIVPGLDPNDLLGRPAGIGDINGDGLDDILLGAVGGDPHGKKNAGESYVILGSTDPFPATFDLSVLNGANGFVLNGEAEWDQAGVGLSGAGDFNGDGYKDLMISANVDTDSEGTTYVFFGRPDPLPASIELSSLKRGGGMEIPGIDVGDYAGTDLSNAGDFNGDGVGDLVVGAHRADPRGEVEAGEIYVVFGEVR